MVHDIMHDQYTFLKLVGYCTFNFSCTCAHSICLVPPQSAINSLRHSFVNTLILWNTVLASVLMLSPPKVCPAMYLLFCPC